MTVDLTSGIEYISSVWRISCPRTLMPCSFLPHLSDWVLVSQLPEAVWSVRFHCWSARCGKTLCSRQTSGCGWTVNLPSSQHHDLCVYIGLIMETSRSVGMIDRWRMTHGTWADKGEKDTGQCGWYINSFVARYLFKSLALTETKHVRSCKMLQIIVPLPR